MGIVFPPVSCDLIKNERIGCCEEGSVIKRLQICVIFPAGERLGRRSPVDP